MKKLIYVLVIVLTTVMSCKKETPADVIVYQQNFNVADTTWHQYTNSVSSGGTDGGKYHIELDQSYSTLYEFYSPLSINFKYSFSADCSIHIDDASQQGVAGLVFNGIDYNKYTIFETNNSGYYRVVSFEDGVGTELISWTQSSALVAGLDVINHVELRQYDTSLQILINNALVNTLTVARGTNEIKVGLAVGTFAYTPVIGVFDNFVIKKLQ